MKRFVTIILSVMIMITGLAFSSGAIAIESESEPVSEKKTYEDIKVTEFPGYVHTVKSDGYIFQQRNVAAARDVLRYVSKLDSLEDYQKAVADVNFDGKITAADARILLRYCAKLGGFPITLHVGQELNFGPFSSWWTLNPITQSTDKLTIEHEVIPKPIPFNDGDSDKHILHITPNEPGTYTFEVEYIGYTNEVEKSARFDITCIE